MARVDLNIDLGELPDEPEELYRLATVVNVACGGHAGDRESMIRAVARAKQSGARLAAHPSYPDWEHFGRERVPMSLEELYEAVVDQVDALAHIARHAGVPLWGAKPHGALYHAAAENADIAAAVLDAVVAVWPDGVTVVGPGGGHLESESRARALGFAREGFADRRYGDGGKLLPRSDARALIADPAESAAQAVRLAREGGVDTLCVHGDSPHAVAIARAVRTALEQADSLVTVPASR